jgi:hypothetical protein
MEGWTDGKAALPSLSQRMFKYYKQASWMLQLVDLTGASNPTSLLHKIRTYDAGKQQTKSIACRIRNL